jgi:hypothetical protein
MPNLGNGLGHRPWGICKAVAKIPYKGGHVMACCTRFEGHETKSTKAPLKHFDERTKQSWYDEP